MRIRINDMRESDGKMIAKPTFMIVAIMLAALLSASWSAAADGEYRRGNETCSSDFREKFNPNSEELWERHAYARCTIVAGDDATGVAMLYDLADRHSLVTSNFFLAKYYYTDGELTSQTTKTHLDEAIKYYLRTLAIIDLIPTYPQPDYFFHERDWQMELRSHFFVVDSYKYRHQLGAFGHYRRHLYQSPSYQGDRDKSIFPEYNTVMRDSLNKMLYFSRECASLPQKNHFNPDRYKAIM